MKLIRYGAVGAEKPGILLDDQTRKDCSAAFQDWDRAFFDQGGLEKLRAYLAQNKDGTGLPDVDASARWGSCVARPGKLLCIGLNYSDHAKEAGMEEPKEPILFMKGTNTVIGAYDTVLIPRESQKTDWEVELGVIIGKTARYLGSPEEAAGYIAGFCISNDVSERAFQLERGGQWTKGKSCDTFNPLGPFLATSDEIANPQNLALTLDVNGVRKQTGSTKFMIFDVWTIVHYLSQFMTLEAGDVITTGTPPGVGMGQKPPHYLQDGDVMELAIEGLGSQRQVCRNSP